LVDTLEQVFDTDHPLFRKTGLEPELCHHLLGVSHKRAMFGENKLAG